MKKKYRLKNGLTYVMLEEFQGIIYGRVKLLAGNWSSIHHDSTCLFCMNSFGSTFDLTEIKPYKYFKIDDKVLVWDEQYPKCKAHFARVDEKTGLPRVFQHGQSSFTALNNETVIFENCIKAE